MEEFILNKCILINEGLGEIIRNFPRSALKRKLLMSECLVIKSIPGITISNLFNRNFENICECAIAKLESLDY